MSTEAHYRDVQTSTGKPSRECTVIVTYRFYGPEGDYIDTQVPGESMRLRRQGCTEGDERRLPDRAACRRCAIPTDEPEPDSTATSGRRSPVRSRSPTPPGTELAAPRKPYGRTPPLRNAARWSLTALEAIGATFDTATDDHWTALAEELSR